MTLDEMIAICHIGNPTREQVARLCAATNGNAREALTTIAVTVAQRYLNGGIDFGTADSLINSVFAYGVHLDELPDVMYRIYEAFDEGEYMHRDDLPGTDAEIKYTRPILQDILAKRGAV